MNPETQNHLAGEKSPYLLQHAHQPVDWWPWGAPAFEEARQSDKPIFLSIGYSTCHWCHVMAHESFDNPAIANLLNTHFICIKVDREERPDVDRVYMTFVQSTTGSGGWPMSVFLTPDLKPFVGGTYFPPDDRYGRPGFGNILTYLAEAWKNERSKVITQGDQMLAALQDSIIPSLSHSAISKTELLLNGFESISRLFDPELGGFGGAPKFPRPVTLNFLLRFWASGTPRNETALNMALFTLRKMAEGGMHDHLGGGFHRYSVDRFWHIPHFEKMLYDQAQLALAYLDAFQITQEPVFEITARAILDYVLRDMTDPAGGFYSAEDADSEVPPTSAPEDNSHPEKAEGAFYVWTKQEIDSLLGNDEAQIFNQFYGVHPDGNAPHGSDPQGEFKGKNTLIQRLTISSAAVQFKKSEPEIAASLRESRAKLFEVRKSRPRPHLDDKIITAWNGLMISAFARAAQVLDDPIYRKAATHAVVFLRTHLTRADGLVRSFRQGPSDVNGFADDYAFLIQGLLDLYEATFNPADLLWAIELQKKQDSLFADPEHGGYFSVRANDPHILLRMKEDYDGAEPSSNSISALNLLRLAQITGNQEFQINGEKNITAFSTSLERMPQGMPQMLGALDFRVGPTRRIVIAGPRNAPETEALIREVHQHFLPNKVLLLAENDDNLHWLGDSLEFFKAGEKSTAYVCEGNTCQKPVSSADELKALLGT